MTQKKKNQQSTDDHIRALDPMEHVRLRPEMYVGGRDTKALNNVFNEMLDYVIHHARANLQHSVEITLFGPQTLLFRDNSTIIPFQQTSNNGWTFLELMMSFIGAGGRAEFIIEGELSSWPSLTILNPLSREMKVEVRRDGALWEQIYQKGCKTADLIYIRDLAPDEEHGTTFTFTIDNEIFGDAAFDASWIENRLFDVAHLLPGLNITFENAVTGRQSTHYYPDGLAHYITHLNRFETTLHAPMILHMHHRIRVVDQRRTLPFEVDLAMQFLTAPHGEIYSFVKAVEIERRGPHTAAFFEALTDLLLGHSSIISCEDLPDLFLHVTLVMNLWLSHPSFESMTNRTLLNRNIYWPLYEEFSLALLFYFRDYPDLIPQLEALTLENRKKRRTYRPLPL